MLKQNKILETDTIKDLGIYVSNDLKWDKHVNYVFHNASRVSYHIFKSFSTKNIWALLKLYKTYVRPKLEHNTHIWSPYFKKDVIKIESVQRKFTRSAFLRCNIPFDSYSDRLHKINMKTLQDRRFIFDLILLFKTLHGLNDLNFSHFFTLKPHHIHLEEINSKLIPKLNLQTLIGQIHIS